MPIEYAQGLQTWARPWLGSSHPTIVVGRSSSTNICHHSISVDWTEIRLPFCNIRNWFHIFTCLRLYKRSDISTFRNPYITKYANTNEVFSMHHDLNSSLPNWDLMKELIVLLSRNLDPTNLTLTVFFTPSLTNSKSRRMLCWGAAESSNRGNEIKPSASRLFIHSRSK